MKNYWFKWYFENHKDETGKVIIDELDFYDYQTAECFVEKYVSKQIADFVEVKDDKELAEIYMNLASYCLERYRKLKGEKNEEKE